MSSNARANHTCLIVFKEIFEHLLHIRCPQGKEITGRELALSGASVPTMDTHVNMVSPARFPHQLLRRQLKMLFCSCCAFLTSPSLAILSSDTLFFFFQSLLGFFDCLGVYIFFLACVAFASGLGLSIVYFFGF